MSILTQERDVIIGMGDVGSAFSKLLWREGEPLEGYDIDSTKCFQNSCNSTDQIYFLHICIPFKKFPDFKSSVLKSIEVYKPKAIVIHSTVAPRTTQKIQSEVNIPVFYSPIRGVHARMIEDMKRYTKFYSVEKKFSASDVEKTYEQRLNKAGVKTKKMSSPVTLELAKILTDTSYYGWLIAYAQKTKMIADSYGVDFDEMWAFSEEIQKFLNNRPKMYAGMIGGHCVLPNLELLDDDTLLLIKEINKEFSKEKKLPREVYSLKPLLRNKKK